MLIAVIDSDSLLRPYLLSPFPRNPKDLRVPAAMLVGALWTVALLYGMATSSWIALGAVTPIVSIVAAAMFAMKNGNGGGE